MFKRPTCPNQTRGRARPRSPRSHTPLCLWNREDGLPFRKHWWIDIIDLSIENLNQASRVARALACFIEEDRSFPGDEIGEIVGLGQRLPDVVARSGCRPFEDVACEQGPHSDEMITNNAETVRWAFEMARLLGREPMTPNEYRETVLGKKARFDHAETLKEID